MFHLYDYEFMRHWMHSPEIWEVTNSATDDSWHMYCAGGEL